MLLITVPLMIILAITAFLFNNFYNNTSNNQRYTAAGNFLLYHNAMYAYAAANLNNLTPPMLLSQVTNGAVVFTAPVYANYFQSINYLPMGNYNSYLLTYNNVNYVVSSFGNINGNVNYGEKAIEAIATQLQTPNSGTSQNYQVKVALIDTQTNCVGPSILNAGIYNPTNGNVVNSTTYSTIYTALCNSAPSPGMGKYVLMEALQ